MTTDNPHLVDGDFQSDKYPTTPRGKVPLSTKDPMAQDLLWQYAERRRSVDADFADGLTEALRRKGYSGNGRAPLSEAARKGLQEQLGRLANAEDLLRKAMAPFVQARDALDDAREMLLMDHDADIAGTCECGRLLFEGELGHRCDDGPILCEDCAPTWDDMRRQYHEAKARGDFVDSFEGEQEARDADLAVDSHIAAGDGDKRLVWPL